jgi:hypothetical protein
MGAVGAGSVSPNGIEEDVKEKEMEPLSLAISIRQPFVELILTGKKKLEYRSRPTNVRGRVWLYASLTPVDDPRSWRKADKEPGSLPTGVIVGSVEIVGCKEIGPGEFGYVLESPKRCEPWKSPKHAQPVFWRPGPQT